MKKKIILYLLIFSRILYKLLIFNFAFFNSCLIYLFFLQFFILKYLILFLFQNNLVKYNKQLEKKNLIKTNISFSLKSLKLKYIQNLYGFWLRNVKFSLRKFSLKKMSIKKKRIWWSQIWSPNIMLWAQRNLQRKHFYKIKILLKKKNLFLTLISNSGKTLLKQNLGASGFKKRKKFTSFAIETTTLEFFKKAKTILQQRVNALNLKQNLLIKDYKRRFIFVKKNQKFKKLFLNIYIKNGFKYWPYRFIKKGIRKSFLFNFKIRLSQIKNILPRSHSKGLRLRKKRRV